MDHFHYKDGTLHAEEVALSDIAAEVGTPFYCYSTATLTRHFCAVSRSARGLAASDLFCDEVKQQSGGDPHIGRLGGGNGCGVDW